MILEKVDIDVVIIVLIGVEILFGKMFIWIYFFKDNFSNIELCVFD